MATIMNGNVAKETIADVAAKADAETKAMFNTMLDAAEKLEENGRALLDVEQKIYRSSFGLWKEWAQFHINFNVDVVQQSVDQLLAVRERFGIIAENELKRLYELLTSEQKLTLDAAEVFQAQVKVTSEQVAEIFSPVAQN
ncbi:MAG: hypothetical protein KDI79_21830 [Anaerolineae bacterium]|nr:hypothetical protein [Anaerolineae bacterium]